MILNIENEDTITEPELILALQQYAQLMAEEGHQVVPVEQFYKLGDLQSYRQAKAMWATDVDQQFVCPPLWMVGNRIRGSAALDMSNVTFIGTLTEYWNRYADWMTKHKRDALHPNETKEERRLRKERERQSRIRKAKIGDSPEAQALHEAKRQAYQHWLDACRHRKSVMAEQDAIVAEAYAKFETAKALLEATSTTNN